MSTTEQNIAALVSLRVVGASPDEVTARLGLEPTSVLLEGTNRIGRGVRYSSQKKDLWLLEKPAQTLDEVVGVLAVLVKSLAHRRAELHAIRDMADKVDIFVGLFLVDGSGGLELGPDLLEELAELGLAVGLDVYCVSDPD